MRTLLITEKNLEPSGKIIRLEGRFGSEDPAALYSVTDRLLTAKESPVIFDCTALEHINSAAIGVFVNTRVKSGDYGGKVCVFGANKTVQGVFELTGINMIIPMQSRLDECLRLMQTES